MTSSRDFVLISSIEWDFLWQVHQEIASRLARRGARVLYIETTGVRAPGLRDARRVATRLKQWAGSLGSRRVREVARDIHVCSPLVLPPFGPRWQRRVNRRLLVPAIRRLITNLRLRDPVIWSFLPTDTTVDLVRALATPRSAVVYHCLADFAPLASHPLRLLESERELLEMSDLVLTGGAQTALHCSEWSNNVHIAPPGVNLKLFSPHTTPHPSAFPDAAKVHSLPHPVIGYIGGLHRHVDIPLLVALAHARPRWSFVYVGPAQENVGELAALPNVHLIGRKPHEELPLYIAAFDVGIVPYAITDQTETVVPTKINEYMSMGKPVVSTPLRSVRELNEHFEHVVMADAELPAYLAALERAVAQGGDAALVMRRRGFAAEHDWELRFEKIWALVGDALDQASRRRGANGVITSSAAAAASAPLV